MFLYDQLLSNADNLITDSSKTILFTILSVLIIQNYFLWRCM